MTIKQARRSSAAGCYCLEKAMPITYGSVCSGIEAATVAWHPLGWRAEWFAEIEPFPSAVLAYRWPEVSNLGDMTKLARQVLAGSIAAPEVLVGGTPCQAFSVAGMRAGLDDPRGQLTIKYVELADAVDHVRPAGDECVIVWENVPGVLSDKGNAFGCFLGALVGESDALQPSGGKWTDAGCVYGPRRTAAWRVLDAQYFGLAQRRRRVFVVASARAGFDPAAVLFESEGVRRDTAPRRGEGQEAACTLDARTEGGGFPGTDGATGGHVVAPPAWPLGLDVTGPVTACGGTEKKHGFGWGQQEWENGFCVPVSVHGTQDPDVLNDQAHPLGRNSGQENAVLSVALRGREGGATAELGDEVAGCLRASSGGGDKPHVLAPACFPLLEVGKRTGKSTTDTRAGIGIGDDRDPMYTLQAGAQHGVCVTGDITHTLKGEGFDGSEDGTGRGQPIIAAFAENSRSELRYEDGDGQITGTLSTGGGKAGQGTPSVQVGAAVRRLTPRETERLQGFPDDHTLIPWRGKPADECPDGPRYKGIGNSKAVPVVRWIGIRIQRELERAQ